MPTHYYAAVTIARVTYVICIATTWVLGWLLSDVPWPFVIPPAINAVIVSAGVARVHMLGPMQHASSCWGRMALLFNISTFTFVTVLPIFLPTRQKPFANRFAQTIASCVLAFAGCTFVQTPVILFAHKSGIVATRHTIKSLLVQALLHASLFADCWTDCEVSVLLWDRVRCMPALLRGTGQHSFVPHACYVHAVEAAQLHESFV